MKVCAQYIPDQQLQKAFWLRLLPIKDLTSSDTFYINHFDNSNHTFFSKLNKTVYIKTA